MEYGMDKMESVLLDNELSAEARNSREAVAGGRRPSVSSVWSSHDAISIELFSFYFFLTETYMSTRQHSMIS